MIQSEDFGLIFSAISLINSFSIKTSPSKISPSLTILAFFTKYVLITIG